MNHIKNIARTMRARFAADLRSRRCRAYWSACAGAVVALAICVFLMAVRGAALIASAAQARQPVNQILITGGIATFVVAGIAVYAVITAVIHARRIRRGRRPPVIAVVRDIAPDLP